MIVAARRAGRSIRALRDERVYEARERWIESVIAEDCGFGGEEQMRLAFIRNLKVPRREYRKRFS